MTTLDGRHAPRTNGANALFNAWHQACGVRPMPSRADIGPAEIQRLMPNIQLFEVIGGGERFFTRSAGTATYGDFDPAGAFWDEVPFGVERIHVQAALREVVARKQPNLAAREVGDDANGKIALEEVLLPLSQDGQTVNMIIRGLFRPDDAQSTAA